MSNIASFKGAAPREPPNERTRGLSSAIPSSILASNFDFLRSSPLTGSPVTTASHLSSK